MSSWTVIKVQLKNGQRFYDAVESDVPLNPMLNIEYENEGVIKAGSYQIVFEDFTEQEADDFINLTIDEQDEIVEIEYGQQPSPEDWD